MTDSNEDIEEFNELTLNSIDVEDKNHPTPPKEEVTQAESDCRTREGLITSAKMWAENDNYYFPCEHTVNTLPPGQYTVNHSSSRGIYFQRRTVNLDDLIILPDNSSEKIIESIEQFWEREEKFREFKFLWKRGIMLWGPAGSGKTSVVQIMSKKLIDKGGLTVYVTNPGLCADGLQILRKIEPKRPLVVILEDIDAIVDEYSDSSLLALLDGELQIDNVVFIATTNYPERLDKRLINRPSRFDVVKKIGMPSSTARKAYLQIKNPKLNKVSSIKELNKWVELSDGFSIAHLKELIILVEVFGTPLEKAAERLQTMMGAKPSSSESYRTNDFGFTNK